MTQAQLATRVEVSRQALVAVESGRTIPSTALALRLAREDGSGRHVLGLRTQVSVAGDNTPVFERFYGGGLGSVRGFEFRGISPRSGTEEDPVGGEFALTGTAEVNFPLVGETLRGVVFADAGTVEEQFEIGTIRSGVGAGFRLVLPILGNQMPLAVDFAYPVNKDRDDDTQIISFSFGFSQ